jgi:glycine betaine/choline ABC-type transport system substrate-binding protein
MKYYPFTKFYGLKFKDHKAVDVSLKYAGIENDSFDVTEVYATDGLNRKANLKVLADDKKVLPGL